MRLLEQFFGIGSHRLYFYDGMEHYAWSLENGAGPKLHAQRQAFFDILKITIP